MTTYRCTNCGHELRRPTMPFSCPQCGRQAVGLFRPVPAGSSAAPPAPPPISKSSPPPAAPPPVQPRTSAPAAPPPPPAPPTTVPSAPARPVAPAPQARPQTPPSPPPDQPRPASRPTPASRPSPAAPVRTTPAKPIGARPAAPAKAAAKPQAPPPAPEPPKVRERPKPIRPEQFVWAWPAEPPFPEEEIPLRWAPAVDGTGQIYLHQRGRLLALRVEGDQPQVAWEYVTGNHAPGPVVVASDGTLRLHTIDGFLHAMNSSGKQIWAPALVGEPLGWAIPLVDPSGNTWISGYEGGLIKVDADGRPGKTRYFRTRSRFDCPGLWCQGVFYVGSEDGYLFAIDTSGQRGASLWDHAAERGHTGWFVNSGVLLGADGAIVAAAGDEHLYGFASDGSRLWQAKVPGQVLSSPVIDRHGHVYVGLTQSERGKSPRGVLVAVDGNSHRIRWEYPANDAIESTPLLADDDLLYFGDNSGTIHAVDVRGQAQWTAKVESAVRSAGTLIAPQRLAFGLDNGTLVVLRCSSNGLASGAWPKSGLNLGQCPAVE